MQAGDSIDVACAGMLESLQDVMVSDKDAQVVANCMSVLQQACTAAVFYLKQWHGMPDNMSAKV